MQDRVRLEQQQRPLVVHRKHVFPGAPKLEQERPRDPQETRAGSS